MNIPLEWRVLSKKLIESGLFKESRLTPSSLHNIAERGRAFTLIKQHGLSKTIVAFGALWDSKNPEWLEIGTIWIDPSFKGRGISLEIFSSLSNLVGDKSVFLITKNQKIADIAKVAEWSTSKKISDSPCFKANAIEHDRPIGDGRVIYYQQSI